MSLIMHLNGVVAGRLLLKTSQMRCFLLVILLGLLALPVMAAPNDIYAEENLVAWCIVPFDAAKRGPEERAQMLNRLGLRRMAYDWRGEHIPTFDAEIEACKAHGIELTAWWFPNTLNGTARLILAALEKHAITPQLWITGGGPPTSNAEEQAQRVAEEAARIRPIAEAAAQIGCKVGLYNHGGWFGEPENQIAILRALDLPNVGLVYNFHHGHDHLERFPEMFRTMQPYLLALNLNGMVHGGDKVGKKILTIGAGDREAQMLRVVRESGWSGPVGILDHLPRTDSEETLRDNLRGLAQVLEKLQEDREDLVEPEREASLGTDYRGVESAETRARLPLYRTIPAATPEELTPTNGFPQPETLRQWHRSNGNAYGMRYSGLDQINTTNVKLLEVAWTYHSGDGADNVQCNPIIVDGVLFGPTAGRQMVALDAATGKELWRFKPELPARLRLQDMPARRGLLYWAGNAEHAPRIVLTCGNWIYALDPKTGKPVDEFGSGGRVHLPTGGTAAGGVFEEILVVPGFHGDVFGFHVGSGRPLWRFHTVPKPGEFGYETWDAPTGGANSWGGMSLDQERGIAFVATGSPKPNFAGNTHRGDNLFANCLIALDARTGQRLWHFQEIRHDIWDMDLPAAPNLLTITREGQRVDVVAAVTKLGNTLLLDRVSGKPVFPVRLRRAPTSKLPGEQTSPYQPALELPEPFSRQIFSLEEVTNRTEAAEAFVRGRIARANFGFFEPFEEGKPTAFFGLHGGAQWTGATVDPEKGLLYVSANEVPWIVTVFRNDESSRREGQPLTRGEKFYQQACASCHGPKRMGIGMAPPLVGLERRLQDTEIAEIIRNGMNLMPPMPGLPEPEVEALLDFLLLRDETFAATPDKPAARPGYSHNGYPKLLDHEGYPGCKPPWGTLNCIDLNTGRLLWQVPLGEYPELTAKGTPKTGTENFGGPMATAGGLVFCAGTRDEMIRAFDSATGEELWAHKLPFGGFAPPASYEVNGRQFIVIAATGGGKLGTKRGDAYVAFALPERAATGPAMGRAWGLGARK
jgi:quinoprotein glucose dehydrogenase